VAPARWGQPWTARITTIEPLIGITISSILSVMIFMTWFSLNDSYSYP
jgi:hypothetical protein